jgi:hypothetical protein
VGGEIDEDIDAVGADALGQVGIGESRGLDPHIRVGFQARGHEIRVGHIRATEDFEGGAVMVVEGGLHEQGDHMLAEIGRDVSDAQPAIGAAVEVGGYGGKTPTPTLPREYQGRGKEAGRPATFGNRRLPRQP